MPITQFVPFPNAAQFNLRLLLQGQQSQSTLYFNTGFGTDWDADNLRQMCEYLRTWWITNIRPIVSNTAILTEVQGVSLYSELAPVASFSGDGASAGVQEAQPMPNNVTFALSFRSNVRGRGSRGRNYAYGLTEPQVSGNYIDAGVTQSWIDAYQLLRAGDRPVPCDWVVASRYYNKLPRAQGVTTEVLNVIVVDNFVDSQRRRLPSRGR